MQALRSMMIIAALLGLLNASPAAPAQSIQAGTNVIALVSVNTQNGAMPATEWAHANAPKTHELMSFMQGQTGSDVAANIAQGFTTTSVMRFTKTGSSVYSDIECRLTVYPLVYQARRNVGSTATLVLCEFPAFPQLNFSRLLVRWDRLDKLISEYATGTNMHVYLTTARNGESLFRSSLAILSQMSPLVYRSLDNTLSGSARSSCFESLRALYDVRSFPVGQGSLTLTSGVIAASVLENEFTAGYVDGTLDAALKPTIHDSAIVALIKTQLHDLIKSLADKIKNAITTAIVGWLSASFF